MARSSSRLPFDSPHYASPRIKGSLIVLEDQKLILSGESLESNFEQALWTQVNFSKNGSHHKDDV